ncbi:hypothetical protein [Thiobacillus sp. 65-1402]|jgi:hypothetical protein|uniref:hypothetical protein n=1 Tax=Thiobacillus sp. 65-1402 TaxID=1895861 RepID=UPI0025E2FA46|nr:hypothetical protein [Thiobacillus sp. 65-1402]
MTVRTLLQVIAVVVLASFTVPATADLQRGIRNYQEIMAGRKKIEQLSHEELQEALAVHKAIERQRGGSSGGTSRPTYEIEVSHNDELFIINGEKFEAKTYCFNMEEGDRVIFLDGSALGACATATLLNLRTKDKCEVWCE